jgi:HEAT repeat protein
VRVQRGVDARADPEVAAAVVAGRHNKAVCPSCRREHEVQVSLIYHDPLAERLVLVLPDGLRHRELEERALLYRRLAEDGAAAPRYVREFQVAFGAELRALLEAERAPAVAVERERAVGETAARGDADATQLRTVMRQTLPDLRTAAIERWIANREGPSALLCGEEVVVCAALPPDDLEAFLEAELELRVQLHRTPTYPVLAVAVVAGRRSIHALLEIGRAAHRAVLDRLAHDSSAGLELFDAGWAPCGSRELHSRLEENVKQIYASAKQALQHIAPATRSFERARAAVLAPSYERLGRVEVALPSSAPPVESPRAVREAVAAVAHWSEAAAEAYLVEVRSYPLGGWRSLRTDVVRRALDLGLHVPRALTEQVLLEAGVGASWPEVLRRQLTAFSQLALGRRPNDLPLDEQRENWRLLIEECRAAHVPVEGTLRELRHVMDPVESPVATLAAAGRDSVHTPRVVVADGVEAGAWPDADETTGPMDPGASTGERQAALRGLGLEELCALLERRELRRDAALVLCERRDEGAIAPLFVALPRMTRAEANRVLPAAVVAFGARVEDALLDGLRGRKAYLRQGCALGLGTLGAARAVEPLSRLLVDEPTEVWREVARALGDLGDAAIGPLLARFREARGEARERVVRALAHVAAAERNAAVERLARSIDPLARDAARRALGLVDEVRRGEAEVRGGAPPGNQEHSLVRGFSRRFFEALGGVAELSDADLILEEDEPDEPKELPLPREATNPEGTDPRISLPPESDA